MNFPEAIELNQKIWALCEQSHVAAAQNLPEREPQPDAEAAIFCGGKIRRNPNTVSFDSIYCRIMNGGSCPADIPLQQLIKIQG